MHEPLFTGWRHWVGLIAILIGLGVPAVFAAQAWNDNHNNPVIKVKVTGFDPRDLLHGHYLLFRFQWNWAAGQPDEKACEGTECSLCLAITSVDPEATLLASDAATPANCPIRLEGYYQGDGNFDIGFQRYYVPESRARELESLLRQPDSHFRMGLSLKPSGKVVLEKLYFNDNAVENYLRENPIGGQE